MKKKKLSDLDKYVRLCLSSIIIYTIVAVIIQTLTEQELSTTLTTCFFAFFGGEVFLLAMIKKLKLKKGDNENESNRGQLGFDLDSGSGNSRSG